jgi:hypothetical protein
MQMSKCNCGYHGNRQHKFQRFQDSSHVNCTTSVEPEGIQNSLNCNSNEILEFQVHHSWNDVPKFTSCTHEQRRGGDCKPMETRSMTRSLLASSIWPAWRCCRTAFLRHSANIVVFMSKMPKIPKMRWKSVQKLLWFAFSISSHLKKQLLLLLSPNHSLYRSHHQLQSSDSLY